MSDRVHNFLLTLIGVGIGLYSLTLLGGAVFGESTGFRTLWSFLVAIFVGAVGFGFIKRRGWAFLAVSIGLLVSWLYEMVMTILVFVANEPTMGRLSCFLLVTAMIAYLGRWSMERRFRPHLDH